jgi:hypothetical protein
MDLAAASRAAAIARSATVSVELVDRSMPDEMTTLITVRLPDQQATTFRAMRSAHVTQLHVAAAAAFKIESDFCFSLPYPKKLLLQEAVSLDELGLIPEGLLLVVFSDETDTVRKPRVDDGVESKVSLGNILEMELKEQQNITKGVHSHIKGRHPKVANILQDASSAESTPAVNSRSLAVDNVSAALNAVDGLFLKTNVELQTISNSSRTELPIDALKKMVKIEAAQEQRHIARELEKQQHSQHLRRLELIKAGLSLCHVDELGSIFLSQGRHLMLFSLLLPRFCVRPKSNSTPVH